MNKRITIAIFFTVLGTTAFSQYSGFSVASDLSLQRNFKEGQQYWAAGHTTQFIFHLSPKDGLYCWFAFYTSGHFKNNVTATAKSPVTIPQQVNYVNTARMGIKQFSVGWRKYLKGYPDIETGWNLYAYAGFGLVLGNVENTHSVSIDTNFYNAPVYSGGGKFKRLTLDVGTGWEIPLRGDFYFYTEGRVWIPTTEYPSKYLFVNNNAPFVGMLGAGIRLLF